MFLQVHEGFMVAPCCDLKRVQMFMQHALSRIMMGWGTCMFYSSLSTQRRCLLHIQEVRLGGELEVLAAEQGGACPLRARWDAEPRLINPAGSALALHDRVRH